MVPLPKIHLKSQMASAGLTGNRVLRSGAYRAEGVQVSPFKLSLCPRCLHLYEGLQRILIKPAAFIEQRLHAEPWGSGSCGPDDWMWLLPAGGCWGAGGATRACALRSCRQGPSALALVHRPRSGRRGTAVRGAGVPQSPAQGRCRH